MRILVFVKSVPDVAELKFDQEKKTLVRNSTLRVLGYDRRAVEEAVQLKEKNGGSVSIVSMGPPSGEETLRPSLAMGADDAYLLTDPAFAGADTLATATVLALAARKIGFDVILGGQHSIDSETGQLLPEVAQLLGTNLATAVNKEAYKDGKFLVDREYEEGYEQLELEIPATISVTERINRPRQPSPEAIEKAKHLQITKWSAADLRADAQQVGAAGSPTLVKSIYEASYKRQPIIVDGRTELAPAMEKALEAVRKLLREKPDLRGGEDEGARRARNPRPVWVVFLQGHSETQTALELLGKVEAIGLEPVAILVGSEDETMKRAAASAGASSVITIEMRGEARSSADCASAIVQGVSGERPYAVLFPSTTLGREVAGRAAAALRVGLTGDATDLVIDGNDELTQVKPAFGGNIMAEILSSKAPQMATVRPGVWDIRHHENGHLLAKVIRTPPGKGDVKLISKRTTVDLRSEDLAKGKVVIGAGFGVGSPEGFEEVRKYGARLGIPVAATKKLADSGWAPSQLQVGLTGKQISADLYIGVGLSGAAYHLTGLKKSRVLFAINNDPQALIFKACDVGLVGDYKAALPLMEDALKDMAASLQSATVR